MYHGPLARAAEARRGARGGRVECRDVIEESPESFVQRWRSYAAEVQLFPRTEGSPLLECRVGDTILQLLDRTGPYVAAPGTRRVILNPMAERLEPADDEVRALEAAGLGALRGSGCVIGGDGRLTVVDCGVPVVVAVMDEAAPRFPEGRFVSFEGLPPVHGFVVEEQRWQRSGMPENTDDAM